MKLNPTIAGLLLSAGYFVSAASDGATSARLRVRLERTPGDGLQPQAEVDGKGRTHLIWLSGEAGAANVQYAWRDALQTKWSTPIQVNTTPGGALAVGTIRGAKLALGTDRRVHVCWNGSEKAQPRPAQGGAPLLYTRMTSDGRGFEPERNLLGQTRHLDGGAALAADSRGRVFVFWHAAPATGPAEETRRAVYLAASSDGGATFASERVVSAPGSGACGCCGLHALAGPSGTLAVWYRGASMTDSRPGVVLTSGDHGVTFQSRLQDPWSINQCPMSSASLSFPNASTILAAWETAGQIHWGQLPASSMVGLVPLKPEIIVGDRSIKHPVIVSNTRGETMVAWTVGTGWKRGGTLAWRVLDAKQRILEEGSSEGVPVWGSLALVAERNGTFSLIY